MTRTTNNQIDHDTAENMIRRRAKQALANFDEAKAKFTEDFATNPRYAIEWHAEKVAKAQAYCEFWRKVADMLERHGAIAAIDHANDRVGIEVDSFFGSNSTCAWTNALRRCEAEVFHGLRRDLQDLRWTLETTEA